MAIAKDYVTIFSVFLTIIHRSVPESGITSLRAVSEFPSLATYYYNLRMNGQFFFR